MENNNFTPEENNKMNNLYENFLKNRTIKKGLTEEEVDRIISENNNLEFENVQKQSEISKLTKLIGVSKENIDYYKESIEKHKTEKKEIDNEHENKKIVANERIEERKIEYESNSGFKVTGHWIFNIFAIIFGVGAWFSYFATVGTSFIGLTEGDFIFRSDVFSAVWEEKGNFIMVVIMFFSTVGVAFSLLIMYFYRQEMMKPIYCISAIMLILDFTFGYRIVSRVYEQRFLEGLEEVPWKFSFFFSDYSFWLIFLINLTFYVGASTFISLSLNVTVTENINSTKNIDEKNKQIEGERQHLKEKINDFNNRIIKEQENIENNQKKISELEGKIEENNFKIKKNKEKILQLTK